MVSPSYSICKSQSAQSLHLVENRAWVHCCIFNTYDRDVQDALVLNATRSSSLWPWTSWTLRPINLSLIKLYSNNPCIGWHHAIINKPARTNEQALGSQPQFFSLSFQRFRCVSCFYHIWLVMPLLTLTFHKSRLKRTSIQPGSNTLCKS